MKYLDRHIREICVILICTFLLSPMLMGQNHGIYKKLYHHIYISHSYNTDFLQKSNSHKVALKSLKNFYDDGQARMRSRAYTLSRKIYNYSQDEHVKQQVIHDHLEGCLTDRSRSLRHQLSNHLLHFEKEYFDEEAITKMGQLIEEDPNRKQYIVIAGFKGLDELLPRLENFSPQDVKDSWDIVQALARVGDEEAINICRALVKDHPLDIEFFDEILPGLVFTTERRILNDIIEEILDEDVSLIGQRLKDYQRYYMLKHILPIIHEYPFHFVEESQLTEDEFYQQLHFAIDWLHENQRAYTISTMDSPFRSKPNPRVYSDLSVFEFD